MFDFRLVGGRIKSQQMIFVCEMNIQNAQTNQFIGFIHYERQMNEFISM